MSLLSSYMASPPDTPAKQKYRNFMAGVSMVDCENASYDPEPSFHETSEPPLSLRYSKSDDTSNRHAIEPVCANWGESSCYGTSPTSGSHDLKLMRSSKTSCSFQTMSHVYNLDTWRMYRRIQATRTNSEEELLNLLQATVKQIQESTSDRIGNSESWTDDVDHEPESDAIFELDL